MRWVLYPFVALLGLIAIGVAILALAVSFAWPTLPSLEALTDYHPKIPLRVYTADGELIGEYGEERRAFIRIQEVPPVLKHAILAVEDDRFYQHPGVDFAGIRRAAGANLATGSKRQGSSTITMTPRGMDAQWRCATFCGQVFFSRFSASVPSMARASFKI